MNRHRCHLKKAYSWIIFLTFIVLTSNTALAKISVSPANPTTEDKIEITVTGEFGPTTSSCGDFLAPRPGDPSLLYPFLKTVRQENSFCNERLLNLYFRIY